MTSTQRSSPSLWLARAGEQGYALTDCVTLSVIALRYHTVEDARTLSVPEIAEQLEKAGTRVNLTGVAHMLHEFVHSVAIGDLIVTTHLGTRTVYFGEVTGDYFFADPSPVARFLHLRPVDWWGSLDRDTDLPSDRLRDIDRQPTFYELPDPAWWFERAKLAKANTPQVMPPARTTAPSSSGASTGSSTPKAAVTPTQVCGSCGLRKPAAIIHAGICADCL